MVVLIVITAAFQIIMKMGYGPLIEYLPLSVAGQLNPGPQDRYSGERNGRSSEHVQDSPSAYDSPVQGDRKEKKEKDQSRESQDLEKYSAPAPADMRLIRDVLLGFPPQRPSTDEHNMPLRNEDSRAAETDHDAGDDDETLDEHAFDHPAMYMEADTVWIPEDPNGLYRDEVEHTRSAGVDASSDGATMNEKGKVDVARAPPGEDWDDSQQL